MKREFSAFGRRLFRDESIERFLSSGPIGSDVADDAGHKQRLEY